jgi:hypothetical protein
MSRSRQIKPLTKLGLTRKRNEARRRTQRRKSAEGRLSTDGACSVERISNRLRWLAHEWHLSDEIPQVKRTPTEELSDFVQKHGISFEWLLTGKLQYLRQMMLTRAPRGRLPFLTSAEDLKRVCAVLSPEQREILAREVDRLLGSGNEASAPIDQEAQPAADGRACQEVEAVTTGPPVHAGGFPLRWPPLPLSDAGDNPRALLPAQNMD